MSFVNAKILKSPVIESKFIIEEPDRGIVPVESYRLYESTQYEENDVTGENWETENTLRGVVNDVTCP